MTTNTYLKKTLKTNVPMILTLKKRAGSYPEKAYKTNLPTGKMEFLYIFEDFTGNELKHYAKEREEETLSLFQPGEKIQATLQEMMKKDENGRDIRISFLVWDAVGDVGAVAAPTTLEETSRGAGQPPKTPKTESADEEQSKWRRIDTGKCIFGYMNTEMAKGKTPGEAALIAKQAFEVQERVISELCR